MNEIKVKICGITREEDALMAIRHGAHAIGFVFCASARRVPISIAKAIAGKIPKSVELIGVFADNSIADILAISDSVGLTGVQLNGKEDSDFARALKEERPKLNVIKTISVKSPDSFADLEDFASDLVILDSPREPEPISPRSPLDLELVRQYRPQRPFFIAGGLTPWNVGDYVKALSPAGVDVSSGVESSPGIKDETAVRSFIYKLRGVAK